MGLFSKLFRKDTQSVTYAQMLNGMTPIFTQFGQDIYASDVVQQAISCITQELRKLQLTSVIKKGMDIVPDESGLQKVLDFPNPLMSQSDFLEKIGWNLFLNYNSFVIPIYDEAIYNNGNVVRTHKALYPIQPTMVNFIQDGKGDIFTEFHFANGYKTTIRYSDVIHIRYRYSVNEFMGGNTQGQPDNDALLKTLQLNHNLLEGVAKGLKASYSVNGLIKQNTYINDDAAKGNLEALKKRLLDGESGLMTTDLKTEYIPITRDIKLVDAETLKFIDNKILRNYGVPLPILQGDYTKEQYEAFFQKTIEPVAITIEQAFTGGLFTPTQRSHGHKTKLYAKELIFMNFDQIIEIVRLYGDSGTLYENEKRAMIGFRPLKELEGVRMQSLNYARASGNATRKQQNTEGSGENEE